jgi:putative resolvase
MSSVDQYVSPATVKQRYGISSSTLRRWDTDGKLRTLRTPGGFRLYHLGDVNALFHQHEPTQSKAKICYARVSSAHQRGDLERQIADLRVAFPDHEIIQDTGSGLNYKRKGFLSLLERVHEGAVGEVVVTHKDRLCRYGFELVEFLFKKADARLVVLGGCMEEHDSTRELADDLLAVCNYFVAKNNGMRSAENRRKRKQETKEEEEGGRRRRKGRKRTSRQDEEDTPVSESDAESDIDELVRHHEMDVQPVSHCHREREDSMEQEGAASQVSQCRALPAGETMGPPDTIRREGRRDERSPESVQDQLCSAKEEGQRQL